MTCPHGDGLVEIPGPDGPELYACLCAEHTAPDPTEES